MTQLSMDEIPSVDERPPGEVEDSAVARVVHRKASRRSVLRFAAVSAMALGMNVVGWLPPGRPRPAAALTEWFDCRGFYSSYTICVPSSWYHGSDCCSGGWHRNTNSGSGCGLREYRARPTACADRNAWRWAHAYGSFRCSDGQLWYRNSSCTRVHTYSWCQHYIAA
jgi:hypothetical protein